MQQTQCVVLTASSTTPATAELGMVAKSATECVLVGTMVTDALLTSVEIPVLPDLVIPVTQGDASTDSSITHVNAILALEGRPAAEICVPLASAIAMEARASLIGTRQTTSVYAR